MCVCLFVCGMVQLFLCPNVRYELRDGDKLTFADVPCVYMKASGKQQVSYVCVYSHLTLSV